MVEKMVKSVRITATGGAEVMKFVDVSLEKPLKNEITIQHKAIGLNFIDIYIK